MFGLTFDKLVLLAVLACVLIGPSRLPEYAGRLAQLVKSLRRMLDVAKDRVREEIGPEFDDVDWKKLDPSQYDPRRIIREALLEDPPAGGIKERRDSRPDTALAAVTPEVDEAS